MTSPPSLSDRILSHTVLPLLTFLLRHPYTTSLLLHHNSTSPPITPLSLTYFPSLTSLLHEPDSTSHPSLVPTILPLPHFSISSPLLYSPPITTSYLPYFPTSSPLIYLTSLTSLLHLDYSTPLTSLPRTYSTSLLSHLYSTSLPSFPYFVYPTLLPIPLPFLP